MIQDRNRTEPHDIDTNGLTDLFCQHRTRACTRLRSWDASGNLDILWNFKSAETEQSGALRLSLDPHFTFTSVQIVLRRIDGIYPLYAAIETRVTSTIRRAP